MKNPGESAEEIYTDMIDPDGLGKAQLAVTYAARKRLIIKGSSTTNPRRVGEP